MTTPRWDETWHRLIEWTNDQGPSERLAAQILLHDGFMELDPSHPLGGQDGGKDAVCIKDGKRWVMGVYFPRGQQRFTDIEKKFCGDLQGAQANQAEGFAFVTNQELRLAERQTLQSAWLGRVEIYHLERITTILDSPPMATIRKQFLGINDDETKTLVLGGEGGNEPGAGGGGGGVIGSGTGGAGGPGGKVTIFGSEGQAPGAGGGGAGAIGNDAVGGEGGGGGERIEVNIGQEELRELRAAGWEGVVKYEIGRGGKGTEGHGEDGGNTILEFVTPDGKVLKTITARGGKGGKAGKMGG
jgi:hypothetical protein